MTGNLRGGIAATYMALCLLLGGASAGGAFANGILQVLAVVLLVVHVWTRTPAPLPAPARWLAAIFLVLALVAGAQLIPLPPSVWTDLPGRGVVVRSLDLLGLPLQSMPLSLDARRTFASMLWLLPPAAMFLSVVTLTRDERSTVAKTVVAIAAASIVIGAFQILGGNGSPFFLYNVTNYGTSVGFFANTNHLSTLLLCALPLSLVFLARGQASGGKDGSRRGGGTIYAAVAIFIAVGIAMNGSLAGYAMLVPVAAASLLLYVRAAKKKIGLKTWGGIGLAAVLFVGFSVLGPLRQDRFYAKFDSTTTTGRQISIPTTIDAGRDHFPVGSGLGTFRDIYRTYEPSEDVSGVFVNHAHNDYAELFLELGAPGVALILAFLLWWLLASLRAWRADYHGAALARAGSIAIGVVLLHSLVDYPARTSAISALVALAAALLIPPPVGRVRAITDGRGDRRAEARHLSVEAI